MIRLTREQREHARAMKREGKSFDEIARELGCCSRTVRRVVYGRRQRPPVVGPLTSAALRAQPERRLLPIGCVSTRVLRLEALRGSEEVRCAR